MTYPELSPDSSVCRESDWELLDHLVVGSSPTFLVCSFLGLTGSAFSIRISMTRPKHLLWWNLKERSNCFRSEKKNKSSFKESSKVVGFLLLLLLFFPICFNYFYFVCFMIEYLKRLCLSSRIRFFTRFINVDTNFLNAHDLLPRALFIFYFFFKNDVIIGKAIDKPMRKQNFFFNHSLRSAQPN